jgi:arsenate reductase
MKMLQQSGMDFDAINYYIEPIPKAKLKGLLKKMGIKPRGLLRSKEPIYKQFRLAERNLSDDQLVDLMVKHPDHIQRPIIEKGEWAILATPPERLKGIL